MPSDSLIAHAGELLTGRHPIHMAKESAFDEIMLLNEVREGASRRFKLPKDEQPELHQMVLHLAEPHGIPTFRVGSRFPTGLARKLREAGMTLEIADENGLFPERQINTAAEVEAPYKWEIPRSGWQLFGRWHRSRQRACPIFIHTASDYRNPTFFRVGDIVD